MFVLVWCFGALAATDYSRQEERVPNKTVGSVEYKYPGVYTVKASKEDTPDKNAELGITEVSKKTLGSAPLKGQSPAIIMGAAVPYEKKNGPTDFNQFGKSTYGDNVYPPYSYFRWFKIYEPGMNGAPDHWKMSGFDGCYFILRVDVSDLISGMTAEEKNKSFLHVKQEGNKALMVYPGHNAPSAIAGVNTFADSLGNKSYAYSLKDDAASLKDKTGAYQGIPYVDVIIISSGTLVAGADTGAQDAISADINLKFYIDEDGDYREDLTDYAAVPSPAPTNPTWDEQWLAKYYDETKAPEGTTFISYKVKGSDLEIETMMYDDDPDEWKPGIEFWSLHNAMDYAAYTGSEPVPIKLICEVPVLEGLKIDGGRNAILDVNSFDIQIANHQKTGSAALTVTGTGSKLKLQDSFNTTGAELAVGNNATMVIEKGGVFEVAETAQLEVEYDAASTAPGTETPDYDCGVITIRDGGELINNGVITIEGTEGKPIDPANPAQRNIKDAEFHIEAGGTLTNNGALLSYGALYNMGTLVNTGRYEDTITSDDPDKGKFTYHRGIQISWKDDVTQEGVTVGRLHNGMEKDEVKGTSARLENSGDIVLCPGILWNCGTVDNASGGVVYVGEVETAVIPLDPPTVDKPYESEELIVFGEPQRSGLFNDSGASFSNAGEIRAVSVEIVNNGRTGNLTDLNDLNDLIRNMSFDNEGSFTNSGTIALDYVRTTGEMKNTGAGKVRGAVLVSDDAGRRGKVIDSAGTKLTNVYNASKTVNGSTNIWTYAEAASLSITPGSQTSPGKTTVNWTGKAESASEGTDIQYYVRYKQQNVVSDELHIALTAGEEKSLQSYLLPEINGNVVYVFWIDDGVHDGEAKYNTTAVVQVSSDAVNTPLPVNNLEYNGTEQELVTEGGADAGALEYRLGETGSWGKAIPKAKNAGDYQVYYRVAGETDARGPVNVTIEKKEVTVSADDVTSVKGEPQAELSYSVSGLPDGEKLEAGDIQVSIPAGADLSKPGTYEITVTAAGDQYPNYKIKSVNGTYTVTETEFKVTAGDVYKVYGTVDTQGAAYAGFNIKLTVPTDATAYYSYDPTHPNSPEKLTKDNYKTYGATALNNLPAGAGMHTVAYFVISQDENVWVSGTKHVIIEKAKQEAPKNITSKPESAQGAGDGYITGLVPRKMEYRKEGGNGIYLTAYYDAEKVEAGTWLVRYKADDNHYASPDFRVTVDSGLLFTVTFDSNKGSAVDPVTGLAYGDLVPRPEDPVRGNLELYGWYKEGEPYDFDRPVVESFTLIAYWQGTGVPTPNTLYYTGSAQELVTAPEGLPAGYAKIQYALGSSKDKAPTSGWSLKIPTGTDTKVYNVWYRLIGEEGTADTEPECIQVRIQPTTKLVPYKASTETEPGNKAYYIGNDGKLYWDALGLAEITDPDDVIIPPTGPKPKPEPEPEPKPEPEPEPDDGGNKDNNRGSSGGGSSSGGTGRRGVIVISPDGVAHYYTPEQISGQSGRWSQDAGGSWHYTREGGREVRGEWMLISYQGKTSWYAFDENGTMRVGWFTSGGETYYLDQQLNERLGAMVTGWREIQGKWYYFETAPGHLQGRMYHGELTPDGFRVNDDGSWDGRPAVTR